MGSLLENANQSRIAIESNHSLLTKIYEMLLKNNFVNDFVDHGSAIEGVNSKFLSSKLQVEDLRNSLNAIDDDLTNLKSEFKELYRDILLQTISSEKFFHYVERGKQLRLKSGNVMYECEHLNKCLNEAYQEMVKLNSEFKELTQNYQVASQNAVVNEFLDCSKYQEKTILDSDKKVKCGFSESSLRRTNNPDAEFSCLSLDIHKKILDAELQHQEKIEKKDGSMDDSPDSSCCALHEHQIQVLPDKTMRKYRMKNKSIQKSSERINLIPSETSVLEDNTTDSNSGIKASKLIQVIDKEAISDDEFLLHISCSEEDVLSDNETFKNSDSLSSCCTNSDSDNYNSSIENIDLTTFSKSTTAVADNFIEGSSRNIDPIEENELSSSSNWIEPCSSPTQKQRSFTKVSNNCEFQCSSISSSTNSKNTIEESQEHIKSEQIYCSTCQNPIAFKKNDPLSKNPTCRICDNTTDPIETKLEIDDPTSQITNNDSAVENSSKLHAVSKKFQCNICDRYFGWKSSLRNHKRSIHEAREDLKCPVCKKVFNNVRCVQRHALIHSSLHPYECSICHKSYNSPSPLRYHMRKVHGVDLNALKKDQKKVQILRNILKKNLQSIKKIYIDDGSSKYNLRSVQKVKNTLRKDSVRIKKHNSSGTNEVSNFQCNICNLYYPSKQSLRGHKRSIHEGHEDYKCPICDEIFTSKRNMHRHTLIHSLLRPYKCSFCDKSYRHPSPVQYHMNKVHGVDAKTLNKDRKENQIARSIMKENARNICTDRKNSIKIVPVDTKSTVDGATM